MQPKITEMRKQETVNVILAILMGAGTAIVANYFVAAVQFLSSFRPAFDTSTLEFRGFGFTLDIAIGILLSAAFISLLLYLFKLPRFHGPADAIIGANDKEVGIEIKPGLLSALASIAAIGGGAPVGQYGPLVHFGATLSAIIKKFARLSDTSGEVLLGCGVAAGISAAFSAPLAGILFAHEVVLRHFALRTFAPVTIASATAFAVMQNFFPMEPILPQIATSISSFSEVLSLAMIGLIGGVIAVVFMRLFAFFGAQAVKVPGPVFMRPFYPAVVLIIIASFAPQILGLGTETVISTIEGKIGVSVLVGILVLKAIMTAFSISFSFFGGVFSPALLIGIAFGGAVGGFGIANFGFSVETASLCTLAGMGAVISSTIGAPISTILIVLELTQDYQATTGVMISVVFANLISNELFGRSLFDKQLFARGFDMQLSRQDLKLSKVKIGSFATEEYCSLSQHENAQAMMDKLKSAGFVEGYVLSDENKLITKVSLLDLISNNTDGDKNFFKLYDTDSILACLNKLSDFVGESAPIISSDGILIGVINEADVFKAYKEASDQSHSEEV